MLFFRGQTFDVTGVAGRIYSIIADDRLYINALYSTAFTTGVFIDPETTLVHKMRPKGTWMSQIGVVVDGFQARVSVNPSESSPEECQIKPDDCLRFGSIAINSNAEELHFVGGVSTQVSGLSMLVKNKKSFSTFKIKGETVELDIDIVPPPKVPSERGLGIIDNIRADS